MQGSLIGLVCAAHLSGFRLFSKAFETRQFRNRSRYPEVAFSDALKTHVGIEDSRITIRSIEDIFATPPKSTRGRAPAWSADDLARRLFQTWNGRSPREGDDDQPTHGLAAGIARVVAREFDGWRSLADNKEGALISAGRYLATLGASFPRLDDLPTDTDFQPESCTARSEVVVALDWMSFAREWHETIVLSMLTGHGRAKSAESASPSPPPTAAPAPPRPPAPVQENARTAST